LPDEKGEEEEEEEGFALLHFIGFAYQGKDIVFRFNIEYSGLRDFGS